MSEVNQSRITEIFEELRGTCGDLHDLLTPDEECNIAFLRAIDDVLFRCEVCDWWCETEEMSERTDMVCAECDDE